jgi:hypothetical protein
MPSGVITFVDPVGAGAAELSADILATDEVLPVGDAGGFDEEFEERRYLTIGDDLTPHEYVAVENDDDTQQTVTLAAPVGTAYEAGLPVYLWDPDATGEDKRAIEYEAEVRLEGQTNPIPAAVRHAMVPLAGVDALNGARVVLDQDDDGAWFVADVLARTPTVDGSTLDSPSVGVYLGAGSGVVVPTGVWTRITGWATAGGESRHVRVAPSDGLLEVTIAGRYMIIGNVRWEPDTTGGRRAAIVLVEPDDTEVVLRESFAAPEPAGASQFQVTVSRVLTVGQRIGFDVRHSVTGIGATLDAEGDAAGTGTALELVRISTA